MEYHLSYHPKIKNDFLELDKIMRHRINEAMLKKLKNYPIEYGVYLSGILHPHLKLRIGAYRVVYRVDEKKKEVYVLAVGERKDKIR